MVLTAEFDASGFCRVVDEGGEVLSQFQTVYEPAFNRQYPPPFSPDNRVLYVGSWERGLYCYDVAGGSVGWRQGPGRVRRIFPFPEGVTVEMAGRGIYRRAQESGAITGVIKMSGIEIARDLGKGRLFIGPYRRHYLIVHLESLERLGSVAASVLNPDGCLSFVIREVFELDGQIVARGFEEYPGGDYSRRGQREFTRRARAA